MLSCFRSAPLLCRLAPERGRTSDCSDDQNNGMTNPPVRTLANMYRHMQTIATNIPHAGRTSVASCATRLAVQCWLEGKVTNSNFLFGGSQSATWSASLGSVDMLVAWVGGSVCP